MDLVCGHKNKHTALLRERCSCWAYKAHNIKEKSSKLSKNQYFVCLCFFLAEQKKHESIALISNSLSFSCYISLKSSSCCRKERGGTWQLKPSFSEMPGWVSNCQASHDLLKRRWLILIKAVVVWEWWKFAATVLLNKPRWRFSTSPLPNHA